MPMDEHTKSTVRALLDRHPRGYVTEETGFTVTDTGAGLFRVLCLSILAESTAPSPAAIDATRRLIDRWKSAPEMIDSGEHERVEVLERSGHDDAEQVARRLGEATRLVMDRYDGDLQNLRTAAGGNRERLRDLLGEIPGMDDAGCAVFLREVQVFWPETAPFLDDRAAEAARRLGLPTDPDELLADVSRGHEESFGWLVGALALVDAHDEYARVKESARG